MSMNEIEAKCRELRQLQNLIAEAEQEAVRHHRGGFFLSSGLGPHPLCQQFPRDQPPPAYGERGETLLVDQVVHSGPGDPQGLRRLCDAIGKLCHSYRLLSGHTASSAASNVSYVWPW